MRRPATEAKPALVGAPAPVLGRLRFQVWLIGGIAGAGDDGPLLAGDPL